MYLRSNLRHCWTLDQDWGQLVGKRNSSVHMFDEWAVAKLVELTMFWSLSCNHYRQPPAFTQSHAQALLHTERANGPRYKASFHRSLQVVLNATVSHEAATANSWKRPGFMQIFTFLLFASYNWIGVVFSCWGEMALRTKICVHHCRAAHQLWSKSMKEYQLVDTSQEMLNMARVLLTGKILSSVSTS